MIGMSQEWNNVVVVLVVGLEVCLLDCSHWVVLSLVSVSCVLTHVAPRQTCWWTLPVSCLTWIRVAMVGSVSLDLCVHLGSSECW